REVAGNEIFLEHHSDIVAEIENENELAEYELRTEKWDSPVIATTMVQFLNTLFLGKSSSIRRMHRLSKAVIIIDEVQSIPLKCVKMFTLAMNFLSAICGCTIIFSSATQPDFSSTGYNVNFDELDSMTGDYTQDFEIFKRTDIVPQIDKYGYTYDAAAEFVYNKYIENGNILIVVNTKAAAHSLYELIKKLCVENNDDAEVIHLSTNMCPQHRRDRISKIKSLMNAKKAVICVTTQLIEAGVDISFKCVVRSLAGMDSIAQAAGRCNRNGEADEICSVYVINLRDENLGSLQEIKDAQGIANRIFDSSCTDYLSADTIGTYFRCLYSEDKDISYNVREIGDTIFNLISRNIKRFEICNNKQIKYCGQAFKTAGKLFNVIDSNTTDVIVPYNEEASEIISKLNSDITPNEAIAILRKAQKYIVGLYSSTSKKLADCNGMYALKCGAMALNKEYYNVEYGLDIDGGTMETLIM
ncbi:MAG: CRISPR-associated helicase/endonuclease Cas3, partial [Oscillospiraceae bacterium]|nr:CRISPR-associated helicase/endonuclease Cas3 [Oscillospiraceae bacterium]